MLYQYQVGQQPSNWNALVHRTDLGFLGTIARCIAGADGRHPGLIPDLRRGRGLVAASDYGGEHAAADWLTYCFVLAARENVARWVMDAQRLRAKALPDGRRIAFKRLADRARARALPSFLASANDLPGLLACFAVQRKVASLFVRGRLDVSTLQYEPLARYTPHVAEKMLRVTHLLALLVAGVSAVDQDVMWVTDEDPMVASREDMWTLTDVFGRAVGNVLPHKLGHFRVATAASDPGDRSVEDLLAIPDLVAGMLADVLSHMIGKHAAPLFGMVLPRPAPLSGKLRNLADWFSDNTQPLRRLLMIIDETPAGSLRATHLRFHGSREPLL